MLNNCIVIKIKRSDLVPLVREKGIKVKIVQEEGDSFILHVPYIHRQALRGFPHQKMGYLGPIHYFYAIKGNVPLLIGLIFFVLFLTIYSHSIQAIEFNAKSKHNEAIREIIESHYKKVFWLRFLDEDLNTINLTLRKSFPDLEWVDVRREGTVLRVTVLEPGIINKQVVKREGYGDLIARESGFITKFHVRQGVVIVTENQYVKKGDLLVSGNLTIKYPDRAPFYIPAEGKVMARVHRERTVEVPKALKKEEYTGRIVTHTYFSLFGLRIPIRTPNHSYTKFDTIESEEPVKLFHLTLPFGLKKVHYYEKNDIIKLYDKQTSIPYAQSVIYAELSEQLEEGDEILDLLLLRSEETEDRYRYHFLIVTNENIAVFQRRHVDE